MTANKNNFNLFTSPIPYIAYHSKLAATPALLKASMQTYKISLSFIKRVLSLRQS